MLQVSVVKLKDKINFEKNESKACVASSQRIADHSDDVLQRLTETRATLLQVTKQKEANERKLRNEITRLKQQNEKLTDRLRDKGKYKRLNCIIIGAGLCKFECNYLIVTILNEPKLVL